MCSTIHTHTIFIHNLQSARFHNWAFFICSHCVYLEFRNFTFFSIINEKLAFINMIMKKEELKLTPRQHTQNNILHTYTELTVLFILRTHITATRLLLRETSVHYSSYYLPGFLLVHVSALTEIQSKNKWVLNVAEHLYCLNMRYIDNSRMFVRWCLCKVATL